MTVPIYAGALYMSYQATARRLEVAAEHDVDELVTQLAVELDAVIRPIEGGVRTVAGQLEEVDPPPDQYLARIRGILAAWPEVYGSTIAIEVGGAHATAKPFAPYLFRRGKEIAYSDLALESYAYRDLPWYRRAADGRQPVWSLPYFDSGGGDTWMVTYSVPFFHNPVGAGRILAGVVTADLDVNWMTRAAAGVKLGPIGMGWLSSPPGAESFMTPLGATTSRLRQSNVPHPEAMLRDLAEQMLARGITFKRLPAEAWPEPAYLSVRILKTLNWRVTFVIPRAQLLAEARELLTRQVGLGAAGLVLLIAAMSLVAAGISRPLHDLAEAVGKVSEDDQDFELPASSLRRDEIGVLAQALQRMRDSLRRHIELRAESLAQQARVERELEIAASIQQSMLPRHDSRTLPMVAKIAAALVPARQVGGDLYDYLRLPDGSVLFAIGDVSDKGVPAALFMARLSALLRVLGTSGEPPDRLLAAINERLVEGNDACMFVTLGCGLLNINTGQIRYASAGHEPPLLRQYDGLVRPLATHNGPAIGMDAGVDYRLVDGFIAPGDTLVLFTDGVTEATGRDGSLFGTDRLSTLLSDSPDGEPAVLVRKILATVDTQAPDFHTTDDLTVLAISLSPPGVTVSRDAHATHWLIEPNAFPTAVRQTQLWVQAILAARAVAAEIIGDAELIVEEVLTNIRRGSEGSAAADVSIDCALTPVEIVLTVRDNGPAFDPLAHAMPDLDADIADRGIGGLGIAMVRQLASGCHYSRIDDHNVLEIHLQRMSVQ